MSAKKLTVKEAEEKARNFCAYQERSQQEVRNRLYEWGLYSTDVEQIISNLINENFLNELRFAEAYALGKFRIKHWGRQKIKQGLEIKRVPDRMIRKVIDNLPPDDYEKTLRVLLEKKSSLMAENHPLKKRAALTRYALSKGYEQDLIIAILEDMDELR